MTDLVFYDFETTGLSSAFDHPLQFAAIVTDEKFNEIDRVNIRCQVAPHVLPSPYALHLTNISPEQTVNKELRTPFEFAQTLQKYTRDWSPSCWLGYNTIAFDEPMMRQMFYQNLQPEIFATQKHGNNRLDVMKMVFAVHAEAPELFNWPLGNNGKISFKLDRLAPANGFAHEDAHDALADVEATIFIFKKIKEGVPDLFEKLIGAREKKIVSSALENFSPMEVTLRFGGNPPKTYQGCYCGANRNNGNSIGFADFELNDALELCNATKSEVFEAIEGSPKKIRTLAVNRSETFRLIDEPTPAMLSFCQLVSEAKSLQTSVSEVLSERYEDKNVTDLEIEEKIYSGFFNASDKELLMVFQTASWDERVSIVNNFEDNRFRQLGKRLIASYANELLSFQQQTAFRDFIRDRWFTKDETAQWATESSILDDLEDLSTDIEISTWNKFYQSRIQSVTDI